LASELGFAVLAPEQVRSNNPNGCFNWFQEGDVKRGQGEAASIRSMIEWMTVHHRIDFARIFITGFSAGGAMTAAMLAAYPDLFAGGAIIAGLPSGAASNVPEALNAMRHAPEHTAREWGNRVRSASPHKGPWPRISIWHGDADTIVHPSNGKASIAQWADIHGLAFADAEEDMVEGHHHRIWRANDGRVAMEAFEISQIAHTIPVGGPSGQRYGQAGPYFLDGQTSSTFRIAAFWGIATIPPKADTQAARDTDPPPSKRLQTDLGGKISAILKAAGLLRR
jgi:poly(hydroxyalkanoate) depolymerase family esterase